MAIRMMLVSGVRDFKLDIGQVGYFKGIVEDMGLSDDNMEAIRSLVDSKNSIELEFTLDNLGISGDTKERIMALRRGRGYRRGGETRQQRNQLEGAGESERGVRCSVQDGLF